MTTQMTIIRKKSTGEIFLRSRNGVEFTYKGPYKDVAAAKRARNRFAKDAVLRSLGLVKVRGAMGGTYWE